MKLKSLVESLAYQLQEATKSKVSKIEKPGFVQYDQHPWRADPGPEMRKAIANVTQNTNSTSRGFRPGNVNYKHNRSEPAPDKPKTDHSRHPQTHANYTDREDDDAGSSLPNKNKRTDWSTDSAYYKDNENKRSMPRWTPQYKLAYTKKGIPTKATKSRKNVKR